jgi:hypothetical protein
LKHLRQFSETRPKPEAPWNPVKITFDLPADAAKRLSELAATDDQAVLRELGIISLQLQGEKVIICTIRIKDLFKNNRLKKKK